MLDAVILSDLHLGSNNCEAKRITHLLEHAAHIGLNLIANTVGKGFDLILLFVHELKFLLHLVAYR